MIHAQATDVVGHDPHDGPVVARRPHLVGALAGVLAAGCGLAVGEAAARLLPGVSAVEAVGVVAVDACPAWLREWAIRALGESDKPVLVGGLVAVLAVLAGIAGALGVHRPRLALAVTTALGGLGLIAAATGRAGAGFPLAAALLPSILTIGTSLCALAALRAGLQSPVPGDADTSWDDTVAEPAATVDAHAAPVAGHIGSQPASGSLVLDRRRFLTTAMVVGSVGVGAGVAAARPPALGGAASPVPVPSDAAAALPPGADLHELGMAPFHTPNNGFYRVDTALRILRVDAASWRLRVHGLVEREMVLDLGSLLDRPMVERDITLTCVSNEVGGRYVGTARWIGARIDDLLTECGVRDGADAVLSTAVDGFTVGTPLAALTDGRDAMLAVAMNGEPLPPAHGFPVRMVVPGLYGYVSATKWLVDLEVTRFADFDAYWTTRGWAEQAPIKTSARIDHPRTLARLNAGHLSVAGVAWAQHRGIRAVEVRVDDGPWQQATLGAEATVDTWRQWRWDWDATGGRHEITVRATDATGETQTGDRTPPVPDGATGWHTVVIDIFDAIPTGPPRYDDSIPGVDGSELE